MQALRGYCADAMRIPLICKSADVTVLSCAALCRCVFMLQGAVDEELREQGAVEQRLQIAREHRKLSGQVIFDPQATQAT